MSQKIIHKVLRRPFWQLFGIYETQILLKEFIFFTIFYRKSKTAIQNCLAFTCSNSTMETLEECVKYVQS